MLRDLRPTIQWVQSYVTEDRITCVYIAPNADLIRSHAKLGGFPADRALEVATIIDPTTAYFYAIMEQRVETRPNRRIDLVTIVVDDYDEAITYYTRRLEFELVEDTPLGDEKRWVVVAPAGRGGSALLLARAVGDEQRRAVGQQAGRRVFLFLSTDNFQRDFALYRQRGVHFVEEPRTETYGTVAVFTDLYGNRWDLIEHRRDLREVSWDDTKRELLRHFLATIAYRSQKALRGAPEDFGAFRAGENVRTPHELVWHMTGLLGYARTYFLSGTFQPTAMPTFNEEVGRFHAVMGDLGRLLETATPERTVSPEQLLQGPLADAMTHVGQLAMLRRLAGAPIPPENFVRAAIDARNVSADQPLPAAPDPGWAPNLPPGAPGQDLPRDW